MLLGFSQPDDHAHAPNEWFDLANYEAAIRAIVATFDEIAADIERPECGAGGVRMGESGRIAVLPYGRRTTATLRTPPGRNLHRVTTDREL